MSKVSTAVLISGRGSNLGALVRAAMAPDFPASIDLVISNRPNAPGIDIAMDHNIAFKVIDHEAFDERDDHDQAVSDCLREAGVDLVCLAGYMRLLGKPILSRWRGKMLNIHPSLLPSFRGVDTHERALDRGVRIHGCTVHFVTAEMDGGPIVLQGALAVEPDDDAESLAQRVLTMEHQLYPKALALVAQKKVRWAGEEGALDADVALSEVAHLEPVADETSYDT